MRFALIVLSLLVAPVVAADGTPGLIKKPGSNGIDDRDEIVARMSGALEKLTTAAVKPDPE